MQATPPSLAAIYGDRAERYRVDTVRLGRQSRWLSNARGVSFATWTISWGFALFGSAGAPALWLGGAALLCFLVLIAVHDRVINAETIAGRWVEANEDARARVTGNAWHELIATGEAFRDPAHPYADDLDLFGRASLFQRLSVAKTQLGQARLAQFLLQVATPQEIRERQLIVAELAPLLDLRQHLEVLARATMASASRDPREIDSLTKDLQARQPSDLVPLFEWAESASGTWDRRRLRWLSRLLPLMLTLSVALGYARLVPWWLGLLPLLGNLWLLLSTRAATARVAHMLAASEQTVLGIEPLFQLLESQPSDGSLRRALDRYLRTDGTSPSLACRTLRRIAGWFEFRHNGLVYPFVNLCLVWDLQCVLAFEIWRERYGQYLRRWFAAIGEVEALSSMAGFLHDEPDACFAEIVEDDVCYSAESLGHPLIAREHRVTNDIAELRAGQGLLVTGSNMSGKSTFLRAVGIGAVLGLAGGPVCAKQMRLSPLFVATSMRISDSLASGVSHFYAELRKLASVIAASDAPRPVLFLLDEILHGTNSRERQIGARFVLSHLLRRRALGAVSTHDLGLCELSGELADRLQLVHFRENVVDERMTFDYRLRPGPVLAGNALRLMRSLGLEVPLE